MTKWSYGVHPSAAARELVRCYRGGLKFREIAAKYGIATGRAQQVYHGTVALERNLAEIKLADLVAVVGKIKTNLSQTNAC